MNSDRPPGRSLLLLDSRHVLLDGMMVVDIKLPLEYVAFLGPPMTTLPDFPYAGGALPSSPDNLAERGSRSHAQELRLHPRASCIFGKRCMAMPASWTHDCASSQ